jgi:16S rRNA (guanine(966)-N(2))-methyltransferase RsmD
LASPRIIAGKAKGFRLKSVPGDSTRPITDRVKEAVFNIIAGDIVGATFLDLFGGTGSVGLEALSRGASRCLFLDINQRAIQILKSNLMATGLDEFGIVKLQDAIRFLSQSPDQTFDYIYIAPPQYKELWEKTLRILDARDGWSGEDGWVIVQIHPIEYKKLDFKHFVEFDQRVYGSTKLVFFEHRADGFIP